MSTKQNNYTQKYNPNWGVEEIDRENMVEIRDPREILKLINDDTYRKNTFCKYKNVFISLSYFYEDPNDHLYSEGPGFELSTKEWEELKRNTDFVKDVIEKINVFDGITALSICSCPYEFDVNYLTFLNIKYISLSNNIWLKEIGGFFNVKKLFLSDCLNLENITGIYFNIDEINLRNCSKIKLITNFTNFENFVLLGSNIDLNDHEKIRKMTIPHPVVNMP